MNSTLRRWSSGIAAIGLVGGLVAGSASQAHAKNQNPGVIPPNGNLQIALHSGMTYGEWSARWWQWALGLPVDQNPFFDVDGSCANGANGQLGSVWFLTGVIAVSGTAVRECTVPPGQTLFFPVMNTECSTLEPPPFHGDNEQELRACAETEFDMVSAFAEIDGNAVQNLETFIVESPIYTFTVPPDNVLGVAAGTGQSVGKGLYLMLTPLSRGTHVLHFGASAASGFTLDITYNITVSR